MSTAPC